MTKEISSTLSISRAVVLTFLGFLGIASAWGELIARCETSKGVVLVSLEFEKAPLTVANFMTLAEGTRAWIDPSDGSIQSKPYYNGTLIHRTSNSADFKFAQGGSRLGDGTDSPGFSIKDEFDPTLAHDPYVVSMANSGPNSNGAQFFLTGNVTTSSYDGNYSLFGKVSDLESRAVVDLIIDAGPNGTTIQNITFSSTSPGAFAFRETAHALPQVGQAGGKFSVIGQMATHWEVEQAQEAGYVFGAYRSFSLAKTTGSWSQLSAAKRHKGYSLTGSTPDLTVVKLDEALAPSAFYHPSFSTHPGSVTPDHLRELSVTVISGQDQLVYRFAADGLGGEATYHVPGRDPLEFSFALLNFDSSGHKFSAIVENYSSSIVRYLLFKVGCDSADGMTIVGRHSTSRFVTNPLTGSGSWSPMRGGTCRITR